MKALDESGAVIMVPGGQAELVHTWRFFKQKEFVIYTRHKGGALAQRNASGIDHHSSNQSSQYKENDLEMSEHLQGEQ